MVERKRKSVDGFRFVVIALLFLGVFAAFANAVKPASTVSIPNTAPVMQPGNAETAEVSIDDAVLAGPELKSKLEPQFKVQAVQTLREKFMLQVCAANGETYNTPALAQQAGAAIKYVGPCLGGESDKIREQKCSELANEGAREACLKKEYGLDQASDRRKACLELADSDQLSDCLASLRQAVKGYYNNAFKRFLAALDALQTKFEREGLDTAIVVEMRAFVEEKREAFLNASTPDEKKAILQETNAKWSEFKQQVLAIQHKHLVDKALERAANALDKIKETRDELFGKGYDVTTLNAQIAVIEQKITAANETGLEFKEQVRRLLEVKKSLAQARKIIHAILNGQPIPSPEPTTTVIPPGTIPTIAPSMPVQTVLPSVQTTVAGGEVEAQA